MGDVRGFLKHDRQIPERRSVPVRLRDWREVYEPFRDADLRTQASRCMDCGIPFCNHGCPLGNLIPEWNDLVYQNHWRDAIERLHATNNFPEFTGRLCPAPCETSCVLGINEPAVTIKQVEVGIVDRAWDEGWITPVLAEERTGRRVAVIGSGPAGLAAAQQLTRAGHDVVVFERADRIGGLLRYGIPEFKMEKRHLNRRLAQMEAEGTEFRTNTMVGVDLPVAELLSDYDAVVLACGATRSRDLPIPGRDLDGIVQAMEFLPWGNKVQEGDLDRSPVSAEGKHVIIIGGGDTGADCLGTAHRQGAANIIQMEIMPRPSETRIETNPWPQWATIFRTSSAHEEGGDRDFNVTTKRFVGDDEGNLKLLECARVEWVKDEETGRFEMNEVPGSEFTIEAEAVFLAMGFMQPQHDGLLDDLGVEYDPRGNVAADGTLKTNLEKVFACGDMQRGQSLVVHAIASGRRCARQIDIFLMGSSRLPTVSDYARPPVMATDAR